MKIGLKLRDSGKEAKAEKAEAESEAKAKAFLFAEFAINLRELNFVQFCNY